MTPDGSRWLQTAPDDSRWLQMAAGGSRWVLKLQWLQELPASKFIQEKYSTTDHINKAPNVTTEAANQAFRARRADNSIRSNPQRNSDRHICFCFQEQLVDRIKPNQYDTHGMETNRIDSNKINSERSKCDRIKQTLINSNKFKSNQTKRVTLNRIESNRIKWRHVKAS